MTKQALQAVRGMNDIFFERADYWEEFEEILRSWLRAYGYRPIRTPIVEQTGLFRRGVGEVTDIVEKEMYLLQGDELALRPEGTACAVRAAIQHKLLANGPQRLFYMGPMFRHERPQHGRYRQFHQVGAEALGFAGPDIDAELILMLARLWNDLDLQGIELEINSLGQPEERGRHRDALLAYFEAQREALDEDSLRRLGKNPLRILDSKNPAMQSLIEAAPSLLDFLGDASLAHFEGVQQRLRDAAIPFKINPRLVRGLDYYNCTVFEWVSTQLGAQGTVCAGGRYDGLFELLGGKPTPAAGFGLGIERVLELWLAAEERSAIELTEIYIVHQGEKAAALAFQVAEMLRDHGFFVVLHCGGGSFKAQFKKADASGAAWAVIIGDDEAQRDEVSIKPLREEGPQQTVALAALAETIGQCLLGED